MISIPLWLAVCSAALLLGLSAGLGFVSYKMARWRQPAHALPPTTEERVVRHRSGMCRLQRSHGCQPCRGTCLSPSRCGRSLSAERA